MIPEEYGGSGLSFLTYARIVEEVTRGWMSLSGVFNSHLLVAYMIDQHGTPQQKSKYLPRMATGEWLAAIAITEPHAGTDVQNIRREQRVMATAMFSRDPSCLITNARKARFLATVVKTDLSAVPQRRGISIMLVDKGDDGLPGLNVSRQLKKLGYKGLETCEVFYDDVAVPQEQLLGG